MPLCRCQNDDLKKNCRSSLNCAVWHDKEPYCEGCRDNRCQFNKSPVSPRTGFDPYRSMPSGFSNYGREMLVGNVNLVKVRAPQDYQIGFQSYIEAMAAIALGKASASEVVERLDQAMREHEAERQRETAVKDGDKN